MGNKIRIVPYTSEDSQSALLLEEQCAQGESLRLRFLRPTFHARSEVYEKYRILCAKLDDQLIGITAGAEKIVKLHCEAIRAIYLYDLRVHPDHRRYGTATHLVNSLLEDLGKGNCIYSLIAGENRRALALARRILGASRKTVPLTYVAIPVYKKLKEKTTHRTTTASDGHERFLRFNPDIQFVPNFDEKRWLGHITSIITENEKGGFSIWTNENLLQEQVVKVPFRFRTARILMAPFRTFLKLPHIPGHSEIIQSWFLYDLYARDEKDLENILTIANNLAIDSGRTFLYLLMEPHDPLLRLIRDAGLKMFFIPYYFIVSGRLTPSETDRIYIDIRDV